MKDMIKRIREEREGFTLAELLIVVAIIAVLVAIAIPVFNSQLEKSREATDAANIRAAYAEVTAAALTGNKADSGQVKWDSTSSKWTESVKLQQQKEGWQNEFEFPKVITAGTTKPAVGGTAIISCDAEGNASVDITLTKE